MTTRLIVTPVDSVRAAVLTDDHGSFVEIEVDGHAMLTLRPMKYGERNARRLATMLACELLMAAGSKNMTLAAMDKMLDDLKDFDIPRPGGE